MASNMDAHCFFNLLLQHLGNQLLDESTKVRRNVRQFCVNPEVHCVLKRRIHTNNYVIAMFLVVGLQWFILSRSNLRTGLICRMVFLELNSGNRRLNCRQMVVNVLRDPLSSFPQHNIVVIVMIMSWVDCGFHVICENTSSPVRTVSA